MTSPFLVFPAMSPPRTLLLALLLALAFAGAGCEESSSIAESSDDPASDPGLPGIGTLESPFIIEAGMLYEGVAMPARGAVYFAAEGIPTGWHAASTASAADVGLLIDGFETFLTSEPLVSATLDSGAESLPVAGDGISALFFRVDGSEVSDSGTTFDISVMPGVAPPDEDFVLAACSTAPPSALCWQSGGQEYVFDFSVAPGASLTLNLTQSGGNAVFLRTRDCSTCEPFLPFTSNGSGGYGGGGYCHANLFSVGSTGTCQVNPVTDYSPPNQFKVSNNSAAAGITATVSFDSP